ncbi:hypothetical protein OHC33_002442 [Knufia fluminis]|uniref:USP domain-containing protein n=1 Tax=Knufia fluminis TaxID=191047 RepID=A0AAN8F5B3_9EURO|nr:hypothetical protein OHC33_002442 [Knufia fluminis]
MATSPSDPFSRNRSVSTGASELPRHEHKRPRLDTTQETNSELTTNSEAVMDETPRSRTVSPDPAPQSTRPRTPPVIPVGNEKRHVVVSPKSKMTINTRPLSAQSTSHDVVSVGSKDESDATTQGSSDNTSKSDSPVIANALGVESATTAGGDASEPISIPSTPGEDILIEISAPQDIGEPEENMSWSTMSGAPNTVQNTNDLPPIWQSFPYRSGGPKADVIRLLGNVAEVFEGRADGDFTDVLGGINSWFIEIQPLISRYGLHHFCEDIDIYQQLPSLMAGLLKRRSPIPQSVTEQDLVRFAKSFTYIATHILRLDIQRVKRVDDATTMLVPPWMLSCQYIRYLLHLLVPVPGCYLHATLRASKHVHEKDFMMKVATALLQDDPEKPFHALLDLFDGLAQKIPASSQKRIMLVEVVHHFGTLAQTVDIHNITLGTKQHELLQTTTLQFLSHSNEVLQQGIIKQQPWLILEHMQNLFEAYSLLTHCSVSLFPDFARDIFQKARVQCPETDPIDVSNLAGLAFKLTLLKQFIQQGRMELRVYGIETMAHNLVSVWTQSQKLPQHRQQPILDLVISFLRNNEMINYILGVASHPQIVQRSPNVIGFLCVSNHWEPSDSDIAWRAVLDSQDPRSIAAIVDNLKANLGHLNLEALLYLHQKLHETPFEKFDSRMLGFALSVLNHTMAKHDWVSNEQFHVNATMTGLCLHLLREANAPARCCSEIANQVREYVCNFMNREHIMDLTEKERDDILTTICNDIACHNDHATGSVIGMTALLQFLDVLSAAKIIAAYDYAKLLFDDMVALSRDAEGPTAHLDTLDTEFQVRLSCMLHMMLKTPDVFDEDLCALFWINVLTSALPSAVRSRAWGTLAQAYRHVTTLHPFLEFVSSQFMHNLPSSQFGKAVFEFAKESVNFEIRHNTRSVVDVDERLHIPAMERLWRIVLETSDMVVQNEASEFIIHVYLDDDVLVHRSATSIEKTHAALVDRCIQIVIDSAQHFTSTDPATTIGQSDQTSQAISNESSTQHEAHLHRSLMLLRKFLDGLKVRPRYKPTASEALGPVLGRFQKRGTAVEIPIRVIQHPQMRDEQLTWTVGDENTGHEVWQFLSDVTGWSELNLIKGGFRVQLRDDETPIKDAKLGSGLMMVSKAISATSTSSRAIRSSSPVDSKIMHHFGELYALLDAREAVAKAVFDFLTMFSSQEGVVADIKSMRLEPQDLLPVQKPFKLLYFATALRSCIEEESFSNTPNVEFLVYAVHTIVSTLQNIQRVNTEQSLRTTILIGIIETLQLALRAKVPEATSKAYFTEPKSFTEDVLASWRCVQASGPSEDNRHSRPSLNRAFLDVIFEASLHDDRLWQYLNASQDFDQLFTPSILLDPELDSRQSVQEVISRLAGVVPGKGVVKPDSRAPRSRFVVGKIENCLGHVWTHLAPLLAQACEEPKACREVLDAAMAVFEVVSKKLDDATLITTFADLKSLLLSQHNPGRRVYCSEEYLILGLARLLRQCISALMVLKRPAPDTNDLILKVFQRCLFPPLSDSTGASLEDQSVPMVKMETRTALYDLTLSACQSAQALSTIVGELVDSTIDKDAFSPIAANERKALRSEEGYCGLRNLSNTCYLNSLFCHLFMNVKFRELIIGINVVDQNKQKLVAELANVFANMQSSFEKYVSPEDAVESITQYTGEQIDVTVQMDVDEFFNLLFDRLEAQIIDPGAREAFKAMYGGQLVQQIKSKECEHVSERLEPFSAIQIEIKGKSGLEEGLKAYVEGEILQGDNKYSCTGCARHVDAVKRACIKEMPDNLIFNLKRFDYDIMTGMRAKVNDEFQFPETIDMMPYTVDALSKPDENFPPDVFELVGVIIHSGTAETGHYYSFVRQRPSSKNSKDSWVQFNDQDVTKFDSRQMRDQAFGGCDQRFGTITKFYNGYMLFYQRSSSIEGYAQDYPVFDSSKPYAVALPDELDCAIAQENEICLRRYVTQDPSHARFLLKIAERMRAEGEACSATHELEDKLLGTILEYLQQVSSRWKELPDFEESTKLLCSYAQSCGNCALKILEWFEVETNAMTSILRAWYPSARKQFGILFATCHSVLWPLRYPEKKDDLLLLGRARVEEATNNSLAQIAKQWTQLQRSNRGWDQLFGVLSAIAELGQKESTTMVELGFLEKTAEIVWVHTGPSTAKAIPRSVRQNYNMYLAAREKNRIFNHGAAMKLFAELLPSVRLAKRPMTERSRLEATDEEKILLQMEEDGPLEWLRRLVFEGSNFDAADAVIKELCDYPALLGRTSETLIDGLERTRQYANAANFVKPCFVFVQFCSMQKRALGVISKSLAAISDTDGYFSETYLDYVKGLIGLQETVSGLTSDQVRQVLYIQLGNWAPMLLMAPNSMHRDVRNEALMTVNELLFDRIEHLSIEEVLRIDTAMAAIRFLANGSCSHVQRYFVEAPRQGQPRMSLASGQSSQMTTVLEACRPYLDTGNADDDLLQQEVQAVMDHLQLLENQVEPDEFTWDGQSGSDALSEVELSDTMSP